MADQKRPTLSETAIVRWFCYAGFAVCSVLLIAVLSLGMEWWAPLVGTIVYGIPALTMYRQEEARRENLAVIRGTQRAQTGGGFDDAFDDSDDPTQPPMRKN